MIEEFRLGIGSYFEAHRFIWKNKLGFFVFLPGIINLILASVLFAIAWHYTALITTYLLDFTGIKNMDWGWFTWLSTLIEIFFLIILRLSIALLYLSIYKYVVLIIMAPVMAYLSERVEEIITGNVYDFNINIFAKNVIRGVVLALKNILIELVFTFLLLLLAFVPILNFLTPFLIFLVQSYYYGFSMIDYNSERKNLNINESSRFVWRHKWMAVSNGGIFLGIMILPVVGILIGPSYSVVAAALACQKINNRENKNGNALPHTI